MEKCITCGVDSSTYHTGISCFENGELKDYKLIDLSGEKDSDYRFKLMVNSILRILDEYSPDIVVIERMHSIRNIDTLRKLCKIMGVVQGWSAIHSAEYVELSPSEWRKLNKEDGETLPTGRDNLKKWSVRKVNELFDIGTISDDVSDSILIGQAYINKF